MFCAPGARDSSAEEPHAAVVQSGASRSVAPARAWSPERECVRKKSGSEKGYRSRKR
jgi:hypothetical protein